MNQIPNAKRSENQMMKTLNKTYLTATAALAIA